MHCAISVLKGTRRDKAGDSLLNERVKGEGKGWEGHVLGERRTRKISRSDFVHLTQEVHSDELRRVYTRIHADLLIYLTGEKKGQDRKVSGRCAPHCHTPSAARGKEERGVIIIKVTLAHNHSNSRQPIVRRDVARNEREYPTDTQSTVPSHSSARTLAKD